MANNKKTDVQKTVQIIEDKDSILDLGAITNSVVEKENAVARGVANEAAPVEEDKNGRKKTVASTRDDQQRADYSRGQESGERVAQEWAKTWNQYTNTKDEHFVSGFHDAILKALETEINKSA